MTAMPKIEQLTTSRYLLMSNRRYAKPGLPTAVPIYATRTARMMMVDEATAGHLNARRISEITASDLEVLTRAKVVVETQEHELTSVVSKFKQSSEDRSHRRFSLMPTSFCNMGCSYCGQEHYRSRATPESMQLMTDRVLEAIEDPLVNSVAVTWFGGEPLLALRHIREISAKLVPAACRTSTAYHSNMATNGSLLSRRSLHLLYNECLIRSMDVTVDGPTAVHDARRNLKSGRSSFDRTMSMLKYVASNDELAHLRINVRINIDHENQDYVDELLNILLIRGITGQKIWVQFMPVHSWGNDVSQVELGKAHYAERAAAWTEKALSLGLQAETMPQAPRTGTCLATVRNAELLDSEGRMYACSEHPLVPGERDTKVIATLTSLSARLPRPAGQFDAWYDQVGSGARGCSSCPLLPVCGGACPKLWDEGHVPCPSWKYNWVQMLDLMARTRGWTPVN